ncbi:lysozyme inhibitor LprI family protein [Acinetobacter faecalis]|uniref:lysozyme inhibitor LprI family protein n=1 Tax=Acinetobacter faecalis TaxID=2665161 RepID=UPI002A917155|nr:lysozyme inhibitor LprI family protein [Acinetobacter faecalis]MDY6456100.1 lysozyme inhibitor LprI family protein [Acinetobacter faecalis]MDY6481789.1 lysozyme inhibitor LprI family protein [Acinetobacter faecalis]
MKFFKGMLFVACSLFAVNSYSMGFSKKYVKCMKSSNNQIKIINFCQSKELKAQNKRVKKFFKKNIALSNEQEKSNLNIIQINWEKQRDVSCGLINKKPKQLNSANIGCSLRFTSSRADMLEVQVKNKTLSR